MNREIKFRGKNKKHGWIYGYYFVNRGEHFIVQDGKVENPLATYEDYIVDEKTIGQFTGLLDNNGKEIYEGDIVQLDYITTIGKHRIGLSFEVKWCTQEGCWVGWDGFVENTLQQTRKMFVVNGNIHDNPELLKGETE